VEVCFHSPNTSLYQSAYLSTGTPLFVLFTEVLAELPERERERERLRKRKNGPVHGRDSNRIPLESY